MSKLTDRVYEAMEPVLGFPDKMAAAAIAAVLESQSGIEGLAEQIADVDLPDDLIEAVTHHLSETDFCRVLDRAERLAAKRGLEWMEQASFLEGLLHTARSKGKGAVFKITSGGDDSPPEKRPRLKVITPASE